MLRILKDRLLRLGRDDDGVALVVTLAVFFFLYLVCAGVFAIGNAVKERIHLQNAVDAAAYSAAVVQADTISRIATINRAMSWTYSQMCKRQMDYIIYRWLEHACKHYKQDLDAAKAWRDRGHFKKNGTHCGDYFIGLKLRENLVFSQKIGLNGSELQPSHIENPADIESDYLGMATANRKENVESFYAVSQYGIDGLERQIDWDRKTIKRMNEYLENNLIGDLPTHVENAVSAVLKANIPTYMNGQCRYLVRQSRNPSRYFVKMVNTPEDEQQFRAWGGDTTALGPGEHTWFTQHDDLGRGGIQRSYVRHSPYLHAKWSWWSWHCHYHSEEAWPVDWPHPSWYGGFDEIFSHTRRPCPHRELPCDCFCTYHDNVRGLFRNEVGGLLKADCRPDCSYLWNKYSYYYIGERAFPRKLARDYFCSRDRDSSGTITVGLVRENGNPWGSVLGRITGGIYSAFNPCNDTWCFASAKAGYRLFAVQDDEERIYNGEARAFRDVRDYCIDWKETIHTRTRQVVQRTYTVWIKIKIDDREIRVPRYVVRDVWEKPIYVNGIVVGWRELVDRPVYDKDGNFVGWDVEWRENTPGFRKKRYEIPNGWRQGWNLTQSDWDAVMIPVRQAGSAAEETDNREMRLSRYGSHQGWMDEVARLERERGWEHDVNRRNVAYRYEPTWGTPKADFVRDLVYDPDWKRLNQGTFSSSVRTPVTTDVFAGGRHDPDPNGRWGRRLVEESASWRGWWDMPSEVDRRNGTFGCRWRIENPGNRLDWQQITDMMYH